VHNAHKRGKSHKGVLQCYSVIAYIFYILSFDTHIYSKFVLKILVTKITCICFSFHVIPGNDQSYQCFWDLALLLPRNHSYLLITLTQFSLYAVM